MTRKSIIDLADKLIAEKVYNAFSNNEISKIIGIKTASVHYHFPAKSDLGVATINDHIERIELIKASTANEPAPIKLDRFLSIYSKIKSESKVCIVGSLATDFNTVEEKMQVALKSFTSLLLNWLEKILVEGRAAGNLHYSGSPRTKALFIITNMLGILQLSRLTNDGDFDLVKAAIINELTT